MLTAIFIIGVKPCRQPITDTRLLCLTMTAEAEKSENIAFLLKLYQCDIYIYVNIYKSIYM